MRFMPGGTVVEKILTGEKGPAPFCGEMDASALERESVDDAQVLPNCLEDGLMEA